MTLPTKGHSHYMSKAGYRVALLKMSHPWGWIQDVLAIVLHEKSTFHFREGIKIGLLKSEVKVLHKKFTCRWGWGGGKIGHPKSE